MSHTIKMTAAEKTAEGRPIIKDKDALFAACAAMGLGEPEWVIDHRVGDGPLATGWAVKLKDKPNGPLTKWTKLSVFDVQKGIEYADNWPTHGPDHVDVKSGAVRCYTGGRWGSEELLWRLDEQYIVEANRLIEETYLATATKVGDTVRVTKSADGKRTELLIDHASSGAGGGNPLDTPTTLK